MYIYILVTLPVLRSSGRQLPFPKDFPVSFPAPPSRNKVSVCTFLITPLGGASVCASSAAGYFRPARAWCGTHLCFFITPPRPALPPSPKAVRPSRTPTRREGWERPRKFFGGAKPRAGCGGKWKKWFKSRRGAFIRVVWSAGTEPYGLRIYLFISLSSWLQPSPAETSQGVSL